ncbi:hypothetical protein R83H12_01639 [Fibrobacteria bacterium R8-3-H12]
MRNINKKTLGLLAILCGFGFQTVFAQDEDPLFVGYLVGGGDGEISNSYYNSGEENVGENGLATANMKIQGNYINWDFENRIWTFVENENNGYPILCWQFPGNCVTPSSSSSSSEEEEEIIEIEVPPSSSSSEEEIEIVEIEVPPSSSSSEEEQEPEHKEITDFKPQIAKGSINVRTTFNAIVISNLSANAKVEVYNVQGKRIYSTINNSVASYLEIPIHVKGMYIIKIGNQSVQAAVK